MCLTHTLVFGQLAGFACKFLAVRNKADQAGTAVQMKNMARELSQWDSKEQFELVACFVEGVPGLENRKTKELDGITDTSKCIELLRKLDMVTFVPHVKDGTNTHAVMFCFGVLFDTTQEYPLSLSLKSLNFVAGAPGFDGIWRAKVFAFGNKLKSKLSRY